MSRDNYETLGLMLRSGHVKDQHLFGLLKELVRCWDDIMYHGQLHGVIVSDDMPEAFRAAMYKFKGRVFPPLPPQNWEEMQLIAMLKVCLERQDQLSWLLTGLNAYLYV